MKNKKTVIYIGILAVGVLFGWILFGNSSEEKTVHNHAEMSETNKMWTCSMHPQIMQPEAGDCPICGMDLIPAETSADGLLADQFKLTENAMALANIQTSVVGKITNKDVTTTLSGKIAENEEANEVQTSYFSGRIERLYINSTGEKVQKGQLLATIYSPELFATQQELITTASLKETQPELYNAVRNKLKLLKVSESQIAKIEETGKVTQSFSLFARVSGIVSQKLVVQGETVAEGQPLLKIANLNTVWANFDVYENQMNQFKKGQDILITTNANKSTEIKGKVAFIDPILNQNTRTLKLRVVLNNKEQLLKPGMFVKGVITNVNSNSKQKLIVPASAVLWTGKRSVVYVKTNPDELIFEMQEITLGNKIGATFEILEGLENGDVIVSNGTFTVDAAAQLLGKKSMMNRKGRNEMTEHEGNLGMENAASAKNENYTNINKRLNVSKDFQQQLKMVFEEYISLKDVFVKGNSKDGIEISKKLINKLSNVDMKLLKDKEVHKHWISIEKNIKASATLISKTANLKEQRNHFKHISYALTNAIEIFGINEKVYHQFCPMADSNKGAYWLSKEEKVINPYFGDAMLTCGEVKQIIE
jgi:Cu(I)/Ag(I) efflux system membrane fusion protein